jgi:hypothetical protein
MTDPSGSAMTLALPAGFDAPRLLRYRSSGGPVAASPASASRMSSSR